MCKAYKRPTAKLLDEPNPDEAGKSAVDDINSGGSTSTSLRHSLAISFSISSMLSQCSVFE